MKLSTQKSQLFVTIVGGLGAIVAAIFALITISQWLNDPIVFVARGGNPVLLSSVMICALGAVIGLLPWMNTHKPKTAISLVAIYGIAICLIGVIATLSVTVYGFFNSGAFVAASGLRTLCLAFIIIVIGVGSVILVLTDEKTKKTA